MCNAQFHTVALRTTWGQTVDFVITTAAFTLTTCGVSNHNLWMESSAPVDFAAELHRLTNGTSLSLP